MQNTHRNKRERVRKKTQGINARTSTVYEHRLNRRVKKVFTGLTDHTEPAAKKITHRLNRCSQSCTRRLIRQAPVKPMQTQPMTPVQFTRKNSRTENNTPVKPMVEHRCNGESAGVVVQRGDRTAWA